jgi:ribosomal RNA-processing protein 7
MAKKAKNKSPAPLIKGYLPVRLKLHSGEDETFFFVKEHRATNAKGSSFSSTRKGGGARSDTLFVVNAPVAPPVPTRALLQALFGRYGNVTRVTVVENPREGSRATPSPDAASSTTSYSFSSLACWTDRFRPPSFLPASDTSMTRGKFAHVVFDSPGEMKKAFRALSDIMSGIPDPREDGNEDWSDKDLLPGLVIARSELQALSPPLDEESVTIRSDKKGSGQSSFGSSRVLAVAQRYQRQYRELSASRPALLEECNRVVREFEQDEENERLAREVASNEPDADGFITVSYGSGSAASTSAIGVAPTRGSSKRELDEDATGRRKMGQKRKRKKKVHGSSELRDFYRFQTKVERKKALQGLRQSFEEDLAKIRKMKEEKQCLPF